MSELGPLNPEVLDFMQGVALSIEREADTWLAYGMLFADNLNWILEPDYNPANVGAPSEYSALIAAYG